MANLSEEHAAPLFREVGRRQMRRLGRGESAHHGPEDLFARGKLLMNVATREGFDITPEELFQGAVKMDTEGVGPEDALVEIVRGRTVQPNQDLAVEMGPPELTQAALADRTLTKQINQLRTR